MLFCYSQENRWACCDVQTPSIQCTSSVKVVGWGKGVVYLTSPGCPTVGQGLLSLQQVQVEGVGCFFCVFFFYSVSWLSFIFLFLPCHFLSSPVLSILSLFSRFSGRRHKMTHKGWRVVKPQPTTSINTFYIISEPHLAKRCLRACAKCTQIHPAHAQSLIRAFALHRNIIQFSVILFVTAKALIRLRGCAVWSGPYAVCIYPKTFSHGAAHVIMKHECICHTYEYVTNCHICVWLYAYVTHLPI